MCSRFEKANIRRADFTAARLDRAEFVGADCEGAVFRNAKMPYSDFSHANLGGADFSGANLLQSKLHRINDQYTNWKGANLKLVEYTDQDLAEAEDWAPPKPE